MSHGTGSGFENEPTQPPAQRNGAGELERRLARSERDLDKLYDKTDKLAEDVRRYLDKMGELRGELNAATLAFRAADWMKTPVWLIAITLSALAAMSVWKTATGQ